MTKNYRYCRGQKYLSVVSKSCPVGEPIKVVQKEDKRMKPGNIRFLNIKEAHKGFSSL